MSARVIAWCVLLATCLAVILGAYCIISSCLAFFQGEASKVASRLDSAPQLRSAVESTLHFASSFIWTTFALLLLALAVSLIVLWIESSIVR